MSFYTYLWLRKSDARPWYVGKGQNGRAWDRYQGHWAPKDRSLILIVPAPSEWHALEYEKLLISCYGRKDLGTGILHNRNDGGFGGDTFSGRHHSAATRATMRKPKPAGFAFGNTNALGKHWSLSDETRNKMRGNKNGRNNLGKKRPDVGARNRMRG